MLTLSLPYRSLLTDKTRIHLRSASVRTYTFLTAGFPRFLSIVEQGDDTRLIYLYLVTYPKPNIQLN
jgi:hypothetical protein